MDEMSIFAGALERADADERAAFLAAACGSDEALRERIEELLAAHERAGDFLVLSSSPEPAAGLARAEETWTSDGNRVQNAVSWSAGARVRYFGDYEILNEIARGGMGVVYRARQLSLDRIVAVKMILTGQLAGEEEVRRFRREAEAAAQLDHAGIVPVYEVGSCEGQPYFSMGFVEGYSLADTRVGVPRPPREAAEWVRQAAEAIQHAHEAGVIHRDLKPGNMLLETRTGGIRVTDFGLARQVRTQSELTRSGQILGTPGYMAPEQVRAEAERVAPEVDIHALGAVLYFLLAGRPPYQADNAVDTLLQTIREEPVSPRRLNAKVPRDLDTICLKCLCKEPSRRYRSAAEVAADLQRFLDGHPIQARPVSRAERAWRWSRRNPLAASLSLLTIVSVLALAMISSIAYVRTARALAESDQRLYSNQLTLASRELDARHRNQALWLLRQTREVHRGWEWRYLMRRCFPEQAVIREEPANARLIWPGGGRRLLEDNGALREPGGPQPARQPSAFLLRDVSADQRTAVGLDPQDASRVKLLDVLTGAIVRQWTIPVEHPLELALSDDGQRLVGVWAERQQLHWRVWSTDSDQPPQSHQRDRARFAGVDLSRRWIGGDVVEDERVRRVVWNIDSGAEILNMAPSESTFWGRECLLEQADGDHLILHDVSGKATATFDPELRVFAIRQSPAGHHLATLARSEEPMSQKHVLHVWRRPGLVLEHTLMIEGQVTDAAISADGRWLAAAAAPPLGTGQVMVWELDSGELVRTLQPRGEPEFQGLVFFREVRFQPNGHELAARVSTPDDRLLWIAWPDFSGPAVELHELPIEHVDGLAMSADGRYIAVRSSRDAQVQTTLLEGARSPDRAARGEASPADLARDLQSRPRVHFRYGQDEKPYELVASNGVRVVYELPTIVPLLGPTDSGKLELRSAGGRLLARLTGHVGLVTALAFSADGRRLATISTDETARGRSSLFGVGVNWEADTFQQSAELKMWSVPEGRLLWTRRGHAGEVTDLTFSPDGGRLATADTPRFGALYPAAGAGEVLVWDVDTGQSLLALRGPASGFSAVTFSQGGDWLAAVAGNRLWVWDGRALPADRAISGSHAKPSHASAAAASLSGVPAWSEDTKFAYLPANECTPEKFEALSRLPRLQQLQIGPASGPESPTASQQCDLPDKLPPVKRLILTSFPALDGRCLPAIANSPSLEHVSAGQFMETVDFSELARSASLREVELRGQFGDAAVRGLNASPALRSVRLDGLLRGDFLADWRSLSQLDTLALRSPIFTSSSLQALAHFPHLIRLELEIPTLKMQDLQVLAQLRQLQSLAILDFVGDEPLLPLPADLPELRSLQLTARQGGARQLTLEQLEALPTNLEHLQLGIPVVNDAGQPLPSLVVLHHLLTAHPQMDVQYFGQRWVAQTSPSGW